MESQFPGRLMAKGTTVKFKFKAILYYKSQLKARPCLTTRERAGVGAARQHLQLQGDQTPLASAGTCSHARTPTEHTRLEECLSGYLLWLLFQKIWSILSTHMAAYNHL